MSIRMLMPLALIVALGTTAGADTPGTSGEPLKVGAAITVKKPTDVGRLARNPRRYVGRTVRIEGTVKGVCQGMGCWVEVASARGATFLARSLDESVLLPKDCAGRKVVVQGVVTAMPAKGAEAHQHAEPPGEGHVCPAPSYLISTQGVELGGPARK
jgi:hypothetical protein